jgi:hypothetical protein
MVYQSAGKYGNRSFSKLLQLIDLPFFEWLRRKRLRDNPVPWITPHIKQLMRKRDLTKWKHFNIKIPIAHVGLARRPNLTFCSLRGISTETWNRDRTYSNVRPIVDWYG